MTTSIKSFSLALLLAVSISTAHADTFGYCTSTVNRDNIFSMGSTEKQGLAIKLPASKVAELKGCTISSISAALGSKRMADGAINLFIATTPDGTPLMSQTVTVGSATKWLSFQLDTPYTITGDEPALFIGYTGNITVGSSMLMADFTADMHDTSFAFKDGEWVDLYGKGYGSATIRFGIENAPKITDLMIKPVKTEGYFRAAEEYSLPCQLFNFGNETVNSFVVNVNVQGCESEVIAMDNVEIAPGTTFDFTLPAWHSDVEGDIAINLLATTEKEDADPTDNIFASTAFFYPAGMERAMLVEGFTGQSCSNCPRGHAAVNSFIESAVTTPVIEVMHHAGYSPDCFTMDADLDYTFFYGSPSTYAPAVMLNREVIAGTVPVMDADESFLEWGYKRIENQHPYVSLSLESSYDAGTRELSVTLNTLTHHALPTATNAINVMLVQDGMTGYQTPYGDAYTHNAVLRGVLTGNSWGVMLTDEACKAGGRCHWTTTFTLPEAIFSDYYNPDNLTPEDIEKCTWPTDPANMRLVAYVAAYGQTPDANPVYNAVETALGEDHVQGGYTAISEVRQTAEGRMQDGIYTISGVKVENMDKPGLYIANGKKVFVK